MRPEVIAEPLRYGIPRDQFLVNHCQARYNGRMATMNVSLPDDLVEFVKDETAQGGYGNQSDVVREGLRLLRERSQKRAVLRRLLAEGQADVAAGRTQPMTDEFLRGVADRAHARAKKKAARS